MLRRTEEYFTLREKIRRKFPVAGDFTRPPGESILIDIVEECKVMTFVVEDLFICGQCNRIVNNIIVLYV